MQHAGLACAASVLHMETFARSQALKFGSFGVRVLGCLRAMGPAPWWLTALDTPGGRLYTCDRKHAWQRSTLERLQVDLIINLTKKPIPGEQ